MAGSNLYATVADLKTRLGITASTQDALLDDLLEIASRSIDVDCNRRFYADSTVSARSYNGNGSSNLFVHDISTTTGLVVALDGVTLTVSEDYEVQPPSTSPTTWLSLKSGVWTLGLANVSVIAKWGWASVPVMIRQAALVRATSLYSRMGKDDLAGETIGDYTYRRFTAEQEQRRNMNQVAQFRRTGMGM